MKVGLAVMRLQPMHLGHKYLIETMLREMDEVIIALGSIQESRTERNPLTFEERKYLLQKVFGEKISIIGIEDIEIQADIEWPLFVFEEIKKSGLPLPNYYYAGTEDDARRFAECQKYPGVYTLQTKVLGREAYPVSATQVREYLAQGDRATLETLIPNEILSEIEKIWKELKD